MNEEKEKCFKQESEAAARHGQLVDVCNWVQLAFRIVALFGEPAKWVVKEIANAWDLYSTSPQEEAHKAFEQKVDELGYRWKELTKSISRSIAIEFARQLGVSPYIVETIKPPKNVMLQELYKRRAEIQHKLQLLDEEYNAELQAIEEEYRRCLAYAQTQMPYEVACLQMRQARIDELNKKYNEKKIPLLRELQEINKLVAEIA